MKTVYKYPLAHQAGNKIEIPVLSNIMCLQMQNGTPTIWALVDTNATKEYRHIRIYATGEPFDEGFSHRYVGTYQIAGFVFHAFEQVSP